MSELQAALQLLMADRHSAEARQFFERLLRYIEARAGSVTRTAWSDLLSPEEVEEVVAEVLKRLMTGALTRFRGDSLGELFAFVRTVTDRCVWQRAQRRLRERRLLQGPASEEVLAWFGEDAMPQEIIERVPEVPLNEADQGFLRELIASSSKAEYARRQGVSRAAVTQRVQRVMARIEALSPKDQAAVASWMRLTARETLAGEP